MFTTSVFRKPAFSGVYTNFNSFLPDCYKSGLIFSLLYRCFTIVSDYSKFHVEISFLKTVLRKNGYNSGFIDRCVKRFLDKFVIVRKRVLNFDVPKKQVLLVLPYLGSVSDKTKTRLLKLFKNLLPTCELKVVFRSSTRLGSFFRFKDKLPVSLLSGVVYRFTCDSCNAIYVGKTQRHLRVRIAEHIGVSALTGKSIKPEKDSAVSQHMLMCNCVASSDNFSIVTKDACNYTLEIKESLTILKENPSLNRNVASKPLFLFN